MLADIFVDSIFVYRYIFVFVDMFAMYWYFSNSVIYLYNCIILWRYICHVYGGLLKFSDKISREGVSVPAGPGLQYFWHGISKQPLYIFCISLDIHILYFSRYMYIFCISLDINILCFCSYTYLVFLKIYLCISDMS